MLGLGVSIWTGGGSAGRPSLALDFLSATLDPRIQITRASPATRINSAGVLETVAANQPRFDYDPVTRLCRGLLIEEQRTNLFTESEFRNGLADASVNGGAVTAAAFPGFAGGLGFAAGTVSYAYKQIAATSGTTYALSVFVRMDDGGAPGLAGGGPGDGTNDFALVLMGGANSPSSCPVVNMGGGLYRVSSTLTATSSGTGNFGVVKYASNSARTFKVTGFQIEVGAFATSYIPTTTAQVTRAVDIAGINTLAPWFNAAQGTLFVEALSNVPDSEVTVRMAAVLSDSVGYTNALRLERLNGLARIVSTVGGASGVQGKAWPAGTTQRLAAAYSTGPVSGALGGTVQAIGSAPPTGFTFLGLGGNGTAGGGGNNFMGYLRTLRYYPRAMAGAELQALTA